MKKVVKKDRYRFNLHKIHKGRFRVKNVDIGPVYTGDKGRYKLDLHGINK